MCALFPRGLRARLVVTSAAISVVVLGVVLAGLYVAVAVQLRSAVDDTLIARLDDLTTAVSSGDPNVIAADPYAQVIGSDGRVLARSAATPTTPLADPAQLRATARSGRPVLTESLPGMNGLALLRVRAAGVRGDLVVAATSLEAVEAARTRTLLLLAAGLPVLVLALAAGVGVVVRAAMHPVRVLTREAEAISVTDLDRRLPEVPGRDEIAELSRTLDAMLQRLATSVERERAFVDDASHELRTPLAVLMGELELALTSDDPDEIRQGVQVAHRESRRLAALAQDMLVLARERAGGPPAGTVLDLRSLASGAVRRLQPLTATVIRVEDASAGGAAVRVVGDRDRLERVLLNIINNAVEAGAGQVSVRVGQDRQEAVLDVSDDGPGFPLAFLPHAFERFRRADPARTRTGHVGSGLGLAIVGVIVRGHGGEVTADNLSVLGGARVVVRLPVAASDHAAADGVA